jgi:hypothetical protein
MRKAKHLLGVLLVAVIVALVVTSRGALTEGGAITLSPLTSFLFNNPIGIDFHEPNGGNLIMSVNWFDGAPNNLDLVNVTTKEVSQFSVLANLTDELKIATQRTSACGQFTRPFGRNWLPRNRQGRNWWTRIQRRQLGETDFRWQFRRMRSSAPEEFLWSLKRARTG